MGKPAGRYARWLAGCLLLLTAACAALPTPADRLARAGGLAAARGWRPLSVPTAEFDLLAFVPGAQMSGDVLTIYIEGDGLAWLSPSHPAPDPTPRDPLGLRLALAQPGGNAAYLGRPCQYVDVRRRGCESRYWTSARFAPEVIAATSQAIDALKRRFGARRLTLVGYSGGGAVAALVAARREDVARLVTVAGNLDHGAWTRLHRGDPLTGSLDAVDEAGRLRAIPQWHFVGAKDDNVTPELVRGFASRFPPERRPVVEVVPGFDHRCCWAEAWPELVARIRGVDSGP